MTKPTRRRQSHSLRPAVSTVAAAGGQLSLLLHPLLLISLLLAGLLLQPVHSFCPSRCRCDEDSSLRIECPNAALDVVPIQLNPDVRFINLTRNHIQNVHFTLQFYSQLEVLDLSYNTLNTLGSKNFEAQEKLLVLNVSGNQIPHLSKDVFRGLRQLRTLDLSDNRVAVIHVAAMLDLISLQTLRLCNNSVVSLENGTFRNMVRLQRAELQQNELLEVPAENLRWTAASLQSVDLSQNYIQTLGNGSFAGLAALRWLSVAGNVINEIEEGAFGALGRLTHLSLDDNNITSIPSSQLSPLSQLTYLSISGNRILSLPALAFVNLFQLKELHVNRMDQLVDIDSKAFLDNTILQTLSMDDNLGLSTIPANLYRNNPKLAEIRMRGCSLRTADASRFPLAQLRRLYLAHNPWVCNCSLLWLWHLAHGSTMAATDQPLEISSHLVLGDKENVSCTFWEEGVETGRRAQLGTLELADIQCPSLVSEVVATLLGVILGAGCAVAFFAYIVARCNRMDRMQRMVAAQQAAADSMRFEYRDHQQAELCEPMRRGGDGGGGAGGVLAGGLGIGGIGGGGLVVDQVYDDDDYEDSDHYEQFDEYGYEQRRHMMKAPTLYPHGLQQPSIVYV